MGRWDSILSVHSASDVLAMHGVSVAPDPLELGGGGEQGCSQGKPAPVVARASWPEVNIEMISWRSLFGSSAKPRGEDVCKHIIWMSAAIHTTVCGRCFARCY